MHTNIRVRVCDYDVLGVVRPRKIDLENSKHHTLYYSSVQH